MVKINNEISFDGKSLILIAGPCVIENEEITFTVASELKKICGKLGVPYIFKTSYDKANRTSINSYRGPGIDKGLKIIKQIKEKLNLPALVDVHCKYDVKKVAEVADIIQIPAFLCRQTDLIVEAAKSMKVINVKKGQFLAPESVKYIIEKIEYTGNKNILITERGTSFGYGRLVVDFSGITVMKKFNYPIIFDATHSVQMPSTGEYYTQGNREVIPDLVYAAIGAGVDAIFMEVHPEPEKALSDSASQFPLNKVEKVLKKAKKLFEVIKSNE